jgi:hypothetical protein
MSKNLKAALLWAASGDNGMSSCAILKAALGQPENGAHHPRDTGDLGRCLRLLRAWPGARVGIRRLAEVDPVWREIDRDWRRISAAARAERVADTRSLFGGPHPITHGLLRAALARGGAWGTKPEEAA